MAGGFQTQVNVVPAPSVPGRRASGNPLFGVLAGPGGLVAGAGGVVAAQACWAVPGALDVDSGAQFVVNHGSGPITGIVANESQGLLVSPFTSASMTIPQGSMVTAYAGGDFWVKNAGAAQCVSGMKAYAKLSDGTWAFAATAAPPGGATSTASTIAAGTFSVTGTITGNQMTVTAVGSGTVVPGAVISGTGITTGNQVGAQISGTAGGVGVYSTTLGEDTVAAGTTISGTYGTLTVGGTLTGTWGVGALVTGGGTSAGTVITALGTGTGGAGTYIVNNTQTVGSGALAATTYVETKWIASGGALTGEFVKITSQPLG